MGDRTYVSINGVEHYRDWSTGNDLAVDRPVDDHIRETQHYKDAHAPKPEEPTPAPTWDEPKQHGKQPKKAKR